MHTTSGVLQKLFLVPLLLSSEKAIIALRWHTIPQSFANHVHHNKADLTTSCHCAAAFQVNGRRHNRYKHAVYYILGGHSWSLLNCNIPVFNLSPGARGQAIVSNRQMKPQHHQEHRRPHQQSWLPYFVVVIAQTCGFNRPYACAPRDYRSLLTCQSAVAMLAESGHAVPQPPGYYW